MKLKLVAIWDVKARMYFAPHFVRNVFEGARGFAQGIRDPGHQLSKFPDDFQLHELGVFDDETGRGEYGDALCIAQGGDFKE